MLSKTKGKTKMGTSAVPGSYWLATRFEHSRRETAGRLVSHSFLELICYFILGCYRCFRVVIDIRVKTSNLTGTNVYLGKGK